MSGTPGWMSQSIAPSVMVVMNFSLGADSMGWRIGVSNTRRCPGARQRHQALFEPVMRVVFVVERRAVGVAAAAIERYGGLRGAVGFQVRQARPGLERVLFQRLQQPPADAEA